MFEWALIVFLLSIVAGVFAFTNVAAGAAGAAKILFYTLLAVFLIVVAAGLLLGALVL